jgi:hypothetical protein
VFLIIKRNRNEVIARLPDLCTVSPPLPLSTPLPAFHFHQTLIIEISKTNRFFNIKKGNKLPGFLGGGGEGGAGRGGARIAPGRLSLLRKR